MTGLFGRGDPPLAACRSCGEPLVSTFERPGYEFVCAVCGRWHEFLSPFPAEATAEAIARADELRAAWDAGTAPAQGEGSS